MNREELTFRSADNVNMIHAVIWTPDENLYERPEGIIQISHGMVEYIERYEHVAQYFTKLGFVVAGNDHLGHGKSVKDSSEWGYVTREDGSRCIVHDLHHLTKLVKERYSGYGRLPYFLMGHSMGSFMVRRYIMMFGDEIDGAVILGTGNQPKAAIMTALLASKAVSAVCGGHYRSALINRLMFGRYNRRIADVRTPNDWICSQRDVIDKYNATPECSFIFTADGIQALMRTLNYIEDKDNIRQIPKNLPIFIASGKDDPVGDYGNAVKQVYDAFRQEGIEDVTLKLYDGCRHELHNELVKEELFDEIYRWMCGRM